MKPAFPSICRDCEKREVGCHSSCKDYLDAKEAYRVRGEEIRRANQGEIDAYICAKESVIKVRKHNHDRKDGR